MFKVGDVVDVMRVDDYVSCYIINVLDSDADLEMSGGEIAYEMKHTNTGDFGNMHILIVKESSIFKEPDVDGMCDV